MPAFLRTLSASARAIYPIVQRGVREGLPIDRILTAARAGGFRIANAIGRELVRKERDVWERGQVSAFTPKSAVLNPRNFPEALTTLKRRYSYLVEAVGLVGGRPRTQSISIASNTPLSVGRAEELARRAIERSEGPSGSRMPIDSIRLVGTLRAGGEGIL